MTDEAAQKDQGQKDDRQRQGHRQHGKADFAATIQRCSNSCLATVNMAVDVLQHYHRVIHHKSHRQSQRQQCQRVQTEAQKPHPKKTAQERERDGNGANQRSRRPPQEQPHHASNQE